MWEETAVRVIRLREYQRLENVPLALAQASALRQFYGRYLDVARAWSGDWDLRAHQYVGSIYLGDVHILIEPKVPIANLFYMLTYAYDLPEFRDEETPLPDSEELFEFIVEIFVRQVQKLVRQGVYRSYLDLEEDDRFLRGRLRLQAQLRRTAVAQRFYQVTNLFTADILENQILRYTLWQLSRLDYAEPTLRPRIRRVLSAFADAKLTPIVPQDCERVVYTRLNRAYHSSINLARILIQHLSLEGGVGDTPFASYLFDMNQLFELFVARMLEQHYAAHASLQIRIQQDVWLDEEASEKGVPDIVLYRDGRPYLVLDTKYKTFQGAPSREDLYQMFVYGKVLGLTRGILIYPNATPIAYRRTFPGVQLQALNLALDGPLELFRARCKAFAERFSQVAE